MIPVIKQFESDDTELTLLDVAKLGWNKTRCQQFNENYQEISLDFDSSYSSSYSYDSVYDVKDEESMSTRCQYILIWFSLTLRI